MKITIVTSLPAKGDVYINARHFAKVLKLRAPTHLDASTFLKQKAEFLAYFIRFKGYFRIRF